MADLKTLEIRNSYDKVVTTGASNTLEDGDGTALATINAATMLQIGGTDLTDRNTSFTITDASGAGLSLTNSLRQYARAGDIEFAHFRVDFPVNSSSTNIVLTGLPSTPAVNISCSARSDVGSTLKGVYQTNGNLLIVDNNGSGVSNSTLSDTFLIVYIVYIA